MTISCSKTFLISTLFILTTTIAFKAQAQPKENLGDKDFDVYVEPKQSMGSEYLILPKLESIVTLSNLSERYYGPTPSTQLTWCSATCYTAGK